MAISVIQHSFYNAIVIIVMMCDVAGAAQVTMRLTAGSWTCCSRI